MPYRPRQLPMRLARMLVVLGLLTVGAAGLARGAGNEVPVLTATGVVDNVLATYLTQGVADAATRGAPAVVVELNTPGGDLQATTQITSAFLTAKVPVIVWVAPSGGRAASAGTFITLAAHLSYMAPGTNIGAASPVDSNGQDIPGTLGQKIKNDAIANITSIAEARGRPVDWAVSTVDKAASYPATQAVAAGAVDGIATSVDDVLAQANGKVVKVNGVDTTVATAGATAVDTAMNPLQSFLHLLSDPNVAFILFTIGVYGLIFEVMNPNFVTGILGAISILLAFIGFGSLPLNVAGLLLLGLGIILFALEPHVVSHGLLTAGGIVCFLLGASALYTVPGNPVGPDVGVALPVILTVTITMAVLMGLVTIMAARTRNLRAPAGTVGVPVPLGTTGVVQAPLSPLGTVHLAGETWSARTPAEATLDRTTPVRLVGFDGLVAIVEPLAPGEAPTPPPAPAPLPADMP
jgi:membrane-bound serine protease (ClpP class)